MQSINYTSNSRFMDVVNASPDWGSMELINLKIHCNSLRFQTP